MGRLYTRACAMSIKHAPPVHACARPSHTHTPQCYSTVVCVCVSRRRQETRRAAVSHREPEAGAHVLSPSLIRARAVSQLTSLVVFISSSTCRYSSHGLGSRASLSSRPSVARALSRKSQNSLRRRNIVSKK